MDQFEEAQKASTTALNSEGSAYRENEAFLDSYQAKLNQLANSWTTLSTTMGEKVLGSGIVVVSESLTSIANATSLVVDKIGLLPPLFTIAGAAFLAFNNHTRTSIVSQGVLATSLVRTGDAMSIATGKSRLLQQQLYNLTLAGRATAASFGFMGKAMGGALSFLTTAALPLAAFAALGAAISYATNKIVEHRQAQKDTQEEIDKLTKSYSDNETQIQSLVSRYEQLDNQVKNGSLSETDKEYLQVQQELYTLLPSVAESVDEKGQAHLRSAGAIREELGYLKELSKVDAEQFINDFQSKLSDLNDQISENQDKLEEITQRQNSGYSELIPWFGVREKAQLEDMADSIIGRRDIEAKLDERKRLFQDLAKSYATYYGVQGDVTEEDQKYIDTIVAKNSELLNTKKGIKEVENEVKAYIGSVGEIRKVSGNLFDTEKIQHIAKYNGDAVKLFNEMSTAIKEGNKDWDGYSDKLNKTGFNASEVTSILNLLKTGHDEATGATVAYVDASEEAVEVEEDRRTSAEKLAGVTKDQVDSVYELIGTYQLLSTLEADNKNKSEELLAVTDQLASLYPHLAKNKKINIEAIQAEAKASDILLTALDSLTQGKLTKEQAQTTATALQAKRRIDILKRELAAQQAVVQKFNELSKTLADNANTLEQEKLASKAYDRAKQLTANIDLELPDFNAQIDALGTVIDYRGREAEAIEKQNNATEKQNEATETSTYITDKYRQALEAVRLELEKQQAIKAKFPTYSKQYQTALKNEISLMEKQKKLIQDQAKSLEKQIKSGNIIQPGISTTSSSSVSTASTMATGSSTAAQIWNFFKSKGFSDNIVAGIMGNLKLESGLNPNAINKSSGATGIAQWLGGRKSALSSYAGSMGTSMYDLNTQLNFLWKELNSTEKRTMSYLSANQNASAAQVAAMFDKLFERSEGTHIPQRQAYANQFLSQFSGAGVSVSASSTVSDTSKAIAEQMQSIDGAKSDLTSLKTELLNLEAEIAQKQMELLKLPIDIYEKRIADQDKNIQNTTNSLYNLSEGTSEYGFKLRQLIAYYKEKQTQNEKEINYMRQLIGSGKLSAIQVAELSEELQGLLDRRYEIAQGRDEINAQIVTNALHKYAKAIEDVNYNLELSRSIQELYVEGSEKYNAETVNQSKLLREKQKLIVDEINKLDELLKKQDLSIESSEEYSNQLKQLKLDLQNLNNELNRSLVDQLSKLRDKQIEGINDYYDTLIERQEERLSQLDEEIEKEDRLQKLREIDDEISKVKNDKRFSYITSEGKEILTYNQERVSELEKQRNEMLEQYQREDLKKAINDEIDRLRKTKDDIVKNEEDKWKSILESAQNGTLNLDSFMKQWYGMNLDVMGDYATQLNSQVSVIKEIFKSLASIKVSLPGVPGLNGSDNPFGMSEADFNKYVQNKKTYESGASGASKAAIENQKLREKYDVGSDNFNYDQLKKYHDGGIVAQSHGSRLAEMANKLFNGKLKPGETITKSLVGEIQVPPKNFSNIFANIGTLMNSLTPNVPSIVSPQGDTYHIHNATIKADNPSELWKGIQMQTRMNRK